MLQNTFFILPGIGTVSEANLWDSGILTWSDFLNAGHVPGISPARKNLYDGLLSEASLRLMRKDSLYFKDLLPASLHWRLYDDFKDEAVFLDIETSGLTENSHITLVGFYSQDGYRVLIRGKNLTFENLRAMLSRYKMIVTFYGSGFDLPFISREFPALGLDRLPHMDLCFAGRKLNLRGGLKNIEKELGISRPDEIQGMSGFHAVILWDRYLDGDIAALETLIKYNAEDVRNLESLAGYMFLKLKGQAGLPA